VSDEKLRENEYATFAIFKFCFTKNLFKNKNLKIISDFEQIHIKKSLVEKVLNKI